MNETPADYGLPHDEWRASQKEALDLVLATGTKPLILELPTGAGKTALAAAASQEEPTLSMVATRDLQQQYAEGYDFSVLWGRAHYPCEKETKVLRWKTMYGFPPTASDCAKMKDCTISCAYKQAKYQAISSHKTIINYHYAWYSEWWHRRKGFLFCDEAHNLAITTIPSLAEVRISEKQRRDWDLPLFPACSGSSSWAIDTALGWTKAAIGKLRYVFSKIGDDDKNKSKVGLMVRKLELLAELLPLGVWYIEGTNIGSVEHPPLFSCRPVMSKHFAGRLTGYHERRIFMSATIGDAEMLANELGMSDYEFHSFPHNIPPERRPVILTDAPAMSYRSTEADYQKQADIIAGICKKHKGERILIHTTRWKHAKDLANRLSRLGLQDRVWVPNQKQGRIEQIKKLTTNDDPDLIALGPSFWEGLDLRGDLCRAVIVAKIPFSDRSDPVIATRLRQEGGNTWDRWVAALKVTQGCGRAVRDETDFAVAYICDHNWTRVSKHAPKWFKAEGE